MTRKFKVKKVSFYRLGWNIQVERHNEIIEVNCPFYISECEGVRYLNFPGTKEHFEIMEEKLDD